MQNNASQNSEAMWVAEQIKICIKRLGKGEDALEKAANAHAVAIAEYDGELGVTIAKLRNGVAMACRGEPVKDPPATNTEKIAKGICEEACLKLELAKAHYKVAMSKLDGIKSQLVGWQSIYKRLDNV